MRGLYTNHKRPIEHFGPMLCSCGSSYSKRSSIAIRPIGPQVPANRLDQRSASLLFEQPSSTSTVSLSTVRRGGLGTSTTKSDARHERMLCSCKLRLRRASPTVGLLSVHGALLGLRRLYAVGAKVCSYRGRVAGLFFSAARRQKRRMGWGISHEHAIVSFHPGQRAARAGIW